MQLIHDGCLLTAHARDARVPPEPWLMHIQSIHNHSSIPQDHRISLREWLLRISTKVRKRPAGCWETVVLYCEDKVTTHDMCSGGLCMYSLR